MLRRIAITGTAALLALTAACGGSSSGESSSGGSGDGGAGGQKTTVNVGLIPIMDVAPIYLGRKKGFFSDHGLKVNVKTAQGGAEIVPGVMSGQFQFGFSNVVSLMLAQEKGLPLQIVANGNNSTGEKGEDFSAVVVPEDSSIEDAADLEGKKVSVNTLQNIGPATVGAAVEKAGGDPSKVNYVELAFPDMPAALKKGRVDAAWVVEPFTTITRQAGARPVAWNFASAAPNLMVAGYFTSDKYAKQHPEVVEAFRAAMKKSLKYAEEHPGEVREIVTSYTDIEPDLLKKTTLPKWPTDINRDSMQTMAKLSKKYDIVSSDVDLNKLLP